MRTALEIWARPGRTAWAHPRPSNLFDELFSSPSWAVTDETNEIRPACDFEETESHYLFSLDIPGVKKEDLKIEVTGDTLTIQGERKSSGRRADDNQYFTERSYGKFSRQFQFPLNVDTENVEAEYEDGVLRIALAKEASAQPRKVEIKAEGSKSGLFDKLLGKKTDQVA